MPTSQALDDFNSPLPILGWGYGASQRLVANSTSANVSNAVGSS